MRFGRRTRAAPKSVEHRPQEQPPVLGLAARPPLARREPCAPSSLSLRNLCLGWLPPIPPQNRDLRAPIQPYPNAEAAPPSCKIGCKAFAEVGNEGSSWLSRE